MKTNRFIIHALLATIFALSLLGCKATADEGGKVPITASSDEARKLYLQGRDLAEKLRGQESLQYFQQAVEKDPNFALAYLNLANNSPSAKGFFENLDKAVALVDKVSEGEKLMIMAAKAGADAEIGKQEEILKKLVSAYPNDERAHNLLGNNYFFAQQQYAKGIEEYKKATEINPDFSPPYNSMGYALRTLEKYDEAEQAFKKYIELIPDDANPYDSYAELHMKIGKHGKAIKHYQRALSVDPDFILAYVGMATCYNYKGEHAKARAQLDKMYKSAKNDGQRRAAHFAKVVSYIDEDAPDNALQELQKQYALAEKINDSAAMAGDLNAMGNILLEQGKPAKAMAKYDKSLSIIESSGLSNETKENARRGYLFNAARVAMKKKDFASAKAKAAEHRKKVNAINNYFQTRLTHELAGTIALEEKDYDTALTELNQANQQNPYNLYRMAMAYEGKGDQDKAQEMYKKAVHFNARNSLNQAFVNSKSRKMMTAK